jgi:hypothetical protein
LGDGFQALLPGLVDKVLFGLLEESLQALAGGLGAAEAFHASDGAAGQGGPRHAQGAQDLQEDICGLGDGLVGHPASPLWGNGGHPNYTPDRNEAQISSARRALCSLSLTSSIRSKSWGALSARKRRKWASSRVWAWLPGRPPGRGEE